MNTDLTVILLTANQLPEKFFGYTFEQLCRSLNPNPLIIVSKKPVKQDYYKAENIVFPSPVSHINIYRAALLGTKEATTKYIAIAEDDVLYSPEHFKKRPTRDNVFAYNVACWSIFTWSNPPIYSYTGRRNLGQLICNRELFIEAMEERFAKFKTDEEINIKVWAEPSKYERQLGVTIRESELFYSDPSNVMFTHPQGLSMGTLGMNKRLAPIRAWDIPFWGKADHIVKMYE